MELLCLGMKGSGIADLKIHALPHMCYHAKFDSSATKSARINKYKRIPKIRERLGPATLQGGA